MTCAEFHDALVADGFTFFSGVPDSLLKDFCAYITDRTAPARHIIAANEGGAIALASGYHLATGNIGVVYLQNAGQGNAVNPLVSLVDPDVYSIPMLLIVGWRGEPGVHDEPQHVKQGKITLDLLKTLGIPYAILSKDGGAAVADLRTAARYMRERSAPFAFVVRKGTFDSYASTSCGAGSNLALSREQAISLVVARMGMHDAVVSTTGMASRELFEYREARGEDHRHDFLTVGSMGHASQIALSIALAQPQRSVYCIDGDGAVIMHAGALAVIGGLAPRNFKHIVINNGAHDSVGGQPTAGPHLDFPLLAKACGYALALQAASEEEVNQGLAQLQQNPGPALLEVLVRKGARKDLGRPTITPQENKQAFTRFLAEYASIT